MKISVVIPMYNSEGTIVSALDSIKNQTNFDCILEILVVNDGSTDHSLSLVENYLKRNKNMPIKIINKYNGGVSSARNIGMKTAKGDWVALLDSDDEWLPNKIELQSKILKDNPDIDFLGGDIDQGGLKILTRKINGLYKASVKDICLKIFPQTSTAIFRRSIYEQIGGYDENQTHGEDANYFLKICSRYNYYHIPIQLVYYGGGKPGFGFSGLSADLRKMHKGQLKNIKELKQSSLITGKFYMFLRLFYLIKYIRRIALTKLRIN